MIYLNRVLFSITWPLQLLKDLHEACDVDASGSGTSAEDQTRASMRQSWMCPCFADKMVTNV